MSLFTRVAIGCVLLIGLWLCAYGGVRLLLSPRQRWLSECGETYTEVDCWERWQREHPMPDSYGREP